MSNVATLSTSAPTRVVVALSGGVDSSVAAALLKERGYDVIGMTLRLYDCQDGQNEKSCCGLSGVTDARAVCGTLGIPYYVIDGQDLFERRVLKHAWLEYAKGRTPNPCVACNSWMKFGLLFDQARKLGADSVATGHHARVVHDVSTGISQLLRGRDPKKDQTYFLFALTPAQLRMTLLPIGDLTKSEVRDHAIRLGLPNAKRAESQDACIAQRGDLAEALRQRFHGSVSSGNFVDAQGNLLGKHEGIHRYTIGQRKGLGIALGERAYVTEIRADRNEVVISSDASELKCAGLVASDVHWFDDGIRESETISANVQIRYQHQAAPATITRSTETSARVEFIEPQGAITPGQAAVFYRGEQVIGGGWIECGF